MPAIIASSTLYKSLIDQEASITSLHFPQTPTKALPPCKTTLHGTIKHQNFAFPFFLASLARIFAHISRKSTGHNRERALTADIRKVKLHFALSNVYSVTRVSMSSRKNERERERKVRRKSTSASFLHPAARDEPKRRS